MECYEGASVGCFSFLPRRMSSRKKKKPVPFAQPRARPSGELEPEREESSTDGSGTDERGGDAAVCESPRRATGLRGGALDTFAWCRVDRKQSRERLVMMPYFGRFAGQWLTFDLRRSDSQVSIRVKVDGRDQTLATLYHRKTRQNECCTLRDRCLNFAHDTKNRQTFRRSPPSLAFLCEKTVLLHSNELPVSQLPAHRFDSLFRGRGRAQDIRVRVWPKGVCEAFHVRIKPRMSVMELQWMLCEKLSLPSPTCLNVYHKDLLENLSHNPQPLQPHLSELECIISTNSLSKEVNEGKSLPVTVSVIGQGIEDVRVHPSMTLCEFEQAVKKTFGLGERSFLYMPQVFKSCKSSLCGITMASLLDGSTAGLITNHRNFPIVVGMPSLKIEDSYKQLPLYQTAISELNLLKASPVIVFEVSGPTIPLAFKTIQAQGYTEDLSYFNPRDSVFALVSVKPHVVSVNPNWTMGTLLKFIESISGFPCEHMKIGERVLAESDTVSSHFVRRWLTVSNSSRAQIRDSIPIPEVATL